MEREKKEKTNLFHKLVTEWGVIEISFHVFPILKVKLISKSFDMFTYLYALCVFS